MMKVSIIIPVYNNENTIERAIRSAIKQTVTDREIIVINDGSTDRTVKKTNKFEEDIEVYHHNRNKGGSAARNTGIQHAEGEYIAFLDADDEWLPSKLKKQLIDLESREDNWIASYCGHESQSSSRNRIHSFLVENFRNKYESTKLEGGKELIPKVITTEFNIGGSSTMLIQKDIIKKMEGFDEDFPRHQDLELLIRLLRLGKIAHLDEPLVIKHNTGVPDPKKVEEAKILFFDKFQQEIEFLESSGINVCGIHHGKLAQRYYHHGQILAGTKHILKADFINKTDMLRTFRDLVVGVYTKL